MPHTLIVGLFSLCLAMTSFAGQYSISFNQQSVPVSTHFVFTDGKDQAILEWLGSAGTALGQVYGRWPHSEWEVEVSPISLFTEDPVPWARVLRGEPDNVSFYISASASKSRLIHDWTVYHEFSHLLIPYRGWGDLWFSEGLASYYQNILQRRVGLLSHEMFWQKLYEGFERGTNDSRAGQMTLSEASRSLRETHAYMRVYWSGAWYFLEADRRLRKATNNGQSLDTVLGKLADCCNKEKLPARTIARKLDQLTGQTLFLELFDEVVQLRSMPPYAETFAALGVSFDSGLPTLDSTHASAEIRDAISRQTLKR